MCAVHKKYRNTSKTELRTLCKCPEDPELGACETCEIIGALDVGIPRSVIFGEKKLNEVFSQTTIDLMCGRTPEIEHGSK